MSFVDCKIDVLFVLKSFCCAENMMENGVAVRRSRRAASLTAQVLWNFQIEDDKNNNTILK